MHRPASLFFLPPPEHERAAGTEGQRCPLAVAPQLSAVPYRRWCGVPISWDPPGGQGGLAHWPAGVPIVPNKSSRQGIWLNLIKFKPYLTIGFKQLTVKEVQSAHISAQTVMPITDTGCPNKLRNGTNSGQREGPWKWEQWRLNSEPPILIQV